jgi:hypothetical protein
VRRICGVGPRGTLVSSFFFRGGSTSAAAIARPEGAVLWRGRFFFELSADFFGVSLVEEAEAETSLLGWGGRLMISVASPSTSSWRRVRGRGMAESPEERDSKPLFEGGCLRCPSGELEGEEEESGKHRGEICVM